MKVAQQIIESIPQRFRKEKATDLQLTMHLNLSGEPTLQYTVCIQQQRCELKSGLHGTPDCVVTTTASHYADLETGQLNPQWALMSGKVKVSNLPVMMQFAKCFRKFKAGEEQHPMMTNERCKRSGPLSGVRVLDFTRLLPGPLATMFLADLGADVIKIEEPHAPDYVRDYQPRLGDESLLYLSFNKNKKSLALDYRHASGKLIVERLVKEADVLVEQFRPGVMHEWGLDYETLKKLNPRLVYVSLTGYGHHNAYSQKAGHDLNYMAMSGLLSSVGSASQITIPGFQAADVAGGSYMVMNAVMAALLQRATTGKGDFVDVAMTDAVLPLGAIPIAMAQRADIDGAAGADLLSGTLPGYNVYVCSDGRWLALGSLEPKFWAGFCSLIQHPEWSNVLLASAEEQQQVKAALAALFQTKTAADWLQFFSNADVCVTPVLAIEELFEQPLQQVRQSFTTFEQPGVGKYHVLNQPMKFQSHNFGENNWPAPRLGEDTVSILKEHGYDDNHIQQLAAAEIIRTA